MTAVRDLFDPGPVLVNAAGTVKSAADARAVLRSSASGLVLGSYTLQERNGNPGSTYFESDGYSLNSLGLPSPSAADWSRIVQEIAGECRDTGKPLFVSVAGFTPDEFKQLADVAYSAGASGVELNLGCPNVWDKGEQKQIFSYSVPHVEAVLSRVAALGELPGPLGAKLSPIFDTPLLQAIDGALAEAGVDYIAAVNTIPNCLDFTQGDVPAITYGDGFAGMSGRAVFPVGLGQAMLHRKAQPNAFIIGVGGIDSGVAMHKYLTAGVDACQIATSFFKSGPPIFTRILSELVDCDSDLGGQDT